MASITESLFDFQVGEVATQSTSVVSGYVWPVIWTVLGVVVVIFLLWYLSFRHKVRIRIVTSNGTFPYNDKAREIKVDGIVFWKFFKRKDVIPVPPRDSLYSAGKDILGKPRFYTEMYWCDEYGYMPVLDEVTRDNFLDKLKIHDDGVQNKKIARDTFRPFTTQQRALLVGQFAKALSRKKKSLIDQITQIAVPIALIGLVLMGLVFWEDIAKPSKEMAVLNQNMLETQDRLLSQSAEISAQNARAVQAMGDANAARELQFQQFVSATAGGGAS